MSKFWWAYSLTDPSKNVIPESTNINYAESIDILQKANVKDILSKSSTWKTEAQYEQAYKQARSMYDESYLSQKWKQEARDYYINKTWKAYDPNEKEVQDWFSSYSWQKKYYDSLVRSSLWQWIEVPKWSAYTKYVEEQMRKETAIPKKEWILNTVYHALTDTTIWTTSLLLDATAWTDVYWKNIQLLDKEKQEYKTMADKFINLSVERWAIIDWSLWALSFIPWAAAFTLPALWIKKWVEAFGKVITKQWLKKIAIEATEETVQKFTAEALKKSWKEFEDFVIKNEDIIKKFYPDPVTQTVRKWAREHFVNAIQDTLDLPWVGWWEWTKDATWKMIFNMTPWRALMRVWLPALSSVSPTMESVFQWANSLSALYAEKTRKWTVERERQNYIKQFWLDPEELTGTAKQAWDDRINYVTRTSWAWANFTWADTSNYSDWQKFWAWLVNTALNFWTTLWWMRVVWAWMSKTFAPITKEWEVLFNFIDEKIKQWDQWVVTQLNTYRWLARLYDEFNNKVSDIISISSNWWLVKNTLEPIKIALDSMQKNLTTWSLESAVRDANSLARAFAYSWIMVKDNIEWLQDTKNKINKYTNFLADQEKDMWFVNRFAQDMARNFYFNKPDWNPANFVKDKRTIEIAEEVLWKQVDYAKWIYDSFVWMAKIFWDQRNLLNNKTSITEIVSEKLDKALTPYFWDKTPIIKQQIGSILTDRLISTSITLWKDSKDIRTIISTIVDNNFWKLLKWEQTAKTEFWKLLWKDKEEIKFNEAFDNLLLNNKLIQKEQALLNIMPDMKARLSEQVAKVRMLEEIYSKTVAEQNRIRINQESVQLAKDLPQGKNTKIKKDEIAEDEYETLVDHDIIWKSATSNSLENSIDLFEPVLKKTNDEIEVKKRDLEVQTKELDSLKGDMDSALQTEKDLDKYSEKIRTREILDDYINKNWWDDQHYNDKLFIDLLNTLQSIKEFEWELKVSPKVLTKLKNSTTESIIEVAKQSWTLKEFITNLEDHFQQPWNKGGYWLSPEQSKKFIKKLIWEYEYTRDVTHKFNTGSIDPMDKLAQNSEKILKRLENKFYDKNATKPQYYDNWVFIEAKYIKDRDSAVNKEYADIVERQFEAQTRWEKDTNIEYLKEEQKIVRDDPTRLESFFHYMKSLKPSQSLSVKISRKWISQDTKDLELTKERILPNGTKIKEYEPETILERTLDNDIHDRFYVKFKDENNKNYTFDAESKFTIDDAINKIVEGQEKERPDYFYLWNFNTKNSKIVFVKPTEAFIYKVAEKHSFDAKNITWDFERSVIKAELIDSMIMKNSWLEWESFFRLVLWEDLLSNASIWKLKDTMMFLDKYMKIFTKTWFVDRPENYSLLWKEDQMIDRISVLWTLKEKQTEQRLELTFSDPLNIHDWKSFYIWHLTKNLNEIAWFSHNNQWPKDYAWIPEKFAFKKGSSTKLNTDHLRVDDVLNSLLLLSNKAWLENSRLKTEFFPDNNILIYKTDRQARKNLLNYLEESQIVDALSSETVFKQFIHKWTKSKKVWDIEKIEWWTIVNIDPTRIWIDNLQDYNSNREWDTVKWSNQTFSKFQSIEVEWNQKDFNISVNKINNFISDLLLGNAKKILDDMKEGMETNPHKLPDILKEYWKEMPANQIVPWQNNWGLFMNTFASLFVDKWMRWVQIKWRNVYLEPLLWAHETEVRANTFLKEKYWDQFKAEDEWNFVILERYPTWDVTKPDVELQALYDVSWQRFFVTRMPATWPENNTMPYVIWRDELLDTDWKPYFENPMPDYIMTSSKLTKMLKWDFDRDPVYFYTDAKFYNKKIISDLHSVTDTYYRESDKFMWNADAAFKWQDIFKASEDTTVWKIKYNKWQTLSESAFYDVAKQEAETKFPEGTKNREDSIENYIIQKTLQTVSKSSRDSKADVANISNFVKYLWPLLMGTDKDWNAFNLWWINKNASIREWSNNINGAVDWNWHTLKKLQKNLEPLFREDVGIISKDYLNTIAFEQNKDKLWNIQASKLEAWWGDISWFKLTYQNWILSWKVWKQDLVFYSDKKLQNPIWNRLDQEALKNDMPWSLFFKYKNADWKEAKWAFNFKIKETNDKGEVTYKYLTSSRNWMIIELIKNLYRVDKKTSSEWGPTKIEDILNEIFGTNLKSKHQFDLSVKDTLTALKEILWESNPMFNHFNTKFKQWLFDMLSKEDISKNKSVKWINEFKELPDNLKTAHNSAKADYKYHDSTFADKNWVLVSKHIELLDMISFDPKDPNKTIDHNKIQDYVINKMTQKEYEDFVVFLTKRWFWYKQDWNLVYPYSKNINYQVIPYFITKEKFLNYWTKVQQKLLDVNKQWLEGKTHDDLEKNYNTKKAKHDQDLKNLNEKDLVFRDWLIKAIRNDKLSLPLKDLFFEIKKNPDFVKELIKTDPRFKDIQDVAETIVSKYSNEVISWLDRITKQWLDNNLVQDESKVRILKSKKNQAVNEYNKLLEKFDQQQNEHRVYQILKDQELDNKEKEKEISKLLVKTMIDSTERILNNQKKRLESDATLNDFVNKKYKEINNRLVDIWVKHKVWDPTLSTLSAIYKLYTSAWKSLAVWIHAWRVVIETINAWSFYVANKMVNYKTFISEDYSKELWRDVWGIYKWASQYVKWVDTTNFAMDIKPWRLTQHKFDEIYREAWLLSYWKEWYAKHIDAVKDKIVDISRTVADFSYWKTVEKIMQKFYEASYNHKLITKIQAMAKDEDMTWFFKRDVNATLHKRRLNIVNEFRRKAEKETKELFFGDYASHPLFVQKMEDIFPFSNFLYAWMKIVKNNPKSMLAWASLIYNMQNQFWEEMYWVSPDWETILLSKMVWIPILASLWLWNLYLNANRFLQFSPIEGWLSWYPIIEYMKWNNDWRMKKYLDWKYEDWLLGLMVDAVAPSVRSIYIKLYNKDPDWWVTPTFYSTTWFIVKDKTQSKIYEDYFSWNYDKLKSYPKRHLDNFFRESKMFQGKDIKDTDKLIDTLINAEELWLLWDKQNPLKLALRATAKAWLMMLDDKERNQEWIAIANAVDLMMWKDIYWKDFDKEYLDKVLKLSKTEWFKDLEKILPDYTRPLRHYIDNADFYKDLYWTYDILYDPIDVEFSEKKNYANVKLLALKFKFKWEPDWLPLEEKIRAIKSWKLRAWDYDEQWMPILTPGYENSLKFKWTLVEYYEKSMWKMNIARWMKAVYNSLAHWTTNKKLQTLYYNQAKVYGKTQDNEILKMRSVITTDDIIFQDKYHKIMSSDVKNIYKMKNEWEDYWEEPFYEQVKWANKAWNWEVLNQATTLLRGNYNNLKKLNWKEKAYFNAHWMNIDNMIYDLEREIKKWHITEKEAIDRLYWNDTITF